MVDVIAFLAAAMVIAALALPITFALLGRMPDGGAGLAPIAGLILVSFGYFFLRVFDLIEAGRGGVLVAIVLFTLFSAVVAGRSRRFWPSLRARGPELVLAAGLFSVLFLGYTSFRAYDPAIEHTEQPMDFLFLNAAVVSPDYPPQDPWLAGERVSYYYFGYVEAAVLTQAAGVDPSVGYNLSLGFFFAASGTAVASLVAALTRWTTRTRSPGWLLGSAGLGLLLLLFVGSLSAVFEWFAAHGNTSEPVYNAFGLEWLLPCEPGQTDACYAATTNSWYPTRFWAFWEGTRIIPDTITEFPFFSFLLGDLHPHTMSIPGVLLALALAAHTWRSRGTLAFADHRRNPWPGLAIATFLAALVFTNTWDAITFSGAFTVAVLARNMRRAPPLLAVRDSAAYLGPVAGVAILALLPWALDFSSQASALLPYVGEGTRPAHAFLQFGPVVAFGLATAMPAFRGGWRPFVGVAAFSLWLPLVPFVAWMIFAAARGDFTLAVEARGAGGWVTLGFYALTLWALVTAFALLAASRHIAAFAAGAATLAVLLFYGAELFLIKDVFFGASPRLNTVFKLTYQAWILLAVAGAVGFVVLLRSLGPARWPRAALATPAALLVGASLVYALLAVPNITAAFSAEPTLDGLAHLRLAGDGEYELAHWVRDNVPPGETVVEASGRAWHRDGDGQPVQEGGSIDYQSNISRIGSRTGVRIPIGWYFHEVQWRGTSSDVGALLSRRQELVDGIYTADDPAVVLRRMDELDASYLVVGAAERSRYAGDLMPDFAAFLDTVFVSGETAVYAVPVYEARGSR